MKKAKRGLYKTKKAHLFLSMTFLFLILILIIITFSTASALETPQIFINEVMPTPLNSSDEWIEIYNPANLTLNLSQMFIQVFNNTNNKSIKNLTFNCDGIPPSNCSLEINTSYFIIIWKKANISRITNQSIVYFNSSCIGNGCSSMLNDNGGLIILYNSSDALHSFNYSSSKNGESWARLENGAFIICDTPTPGMPNNCSEGSTIQLNYLEEVECNKNFSITVNAFNFKDDIYDVKIDILDAYDESHRVGKVWNGTKWLSTNSYVNSALNVSGGNGITTLTYKVDNFEGEAILRPKIRKHGSSSYTLFDDFYIIVKCQQTNLPKESFIEIADAPSDAKFGDEIEIELEVYKGNTSKYAVYLYVQNENGTKVSNTVTLHFYDKFTNYSEKAFLNLKCEDEEGNYEIVAEGLDTQDSKEIKIKKCNENELGESNAITIGDFTYSFTIPNIIFLNQEFQLKVKIESKANSEQEFIVWSYIYNGPRCYSCSDDITRESNAKSIVVQPNSFSEVVISNIVKTAEPGEYKLKIKILQEGLKTPKEFSYNVTIKDSETKSELIQTKEASPPAFHEVSNFSSQQLQTIKSNDSILKSASYILISAITLISIYLIIKKID